MQKIFMKVRQKWDSLKRQIIRVLLNIEGDQITGWLIVILLVVVVGAFFLSTYQNSIVSLWDSIIEKMRNVFGV